MNIRIAKTEDAKRIREIYSYYVLNTATTFEIEVPSEEEFVRRISNTIRRYPYLVLEEDNKVIGYCYASPFKTREAYDHVVESSIYLDVDYRSKGYGSLLYEALESILKKQNVCMIYGVITYAEKEDKYSSNASIYFHEALGYKEVGCLSKSGYKFNSWYGIKFLEKEIAPRSIPIDDFIPFNENMLH